MKKKEEEKVSEVVPKICSVLNYKSYKREEEGNVFIKAIK